MCRATPRPHLSLEEGAEQDALVDEMMADAPQESIGRLDGHRTHHQGLKASLSADPSQRSFNDKRAFFGQGKHACPEGGCAPASGGAD